MKRVEKNLEFKKSLENSAKTIYDEITQNLCLVKLLLASNDPGRFPNQKENNSKCQELISTSISLLRQVADSINEIKNEIQPK